MNRHNTEGFDDQASVGLQRIRILKRRHWVLPWVEEDENCRPTCLTTTSLSATSRFFARLRLSSGRAVVDVDRGGEQCLLLTVPAMNLDDDELVHTETENRKRRLALLDQKMTDEQKKKSSLESSAVVASKDRFE